MCLDCNIAICSGYRRLLISTTFFICYILLGAISLLAQDITSPYSILGIGDIDTREYGRYFSSGGTSIARRSMNGYNFSNPASLTALPLKTIYYDFTFKGVKSRYSYPDADTTIADPSKDISIKRLALAFRTNEKTALAAGIKPFSTVNYSYTQEKMLLDGNSSYVKSVEGTGGINQVYVSLGKQVDKHFSIGITASWLFGSIQRYTDYYGQSLNVDVQKKETNFYTGAQVQFGFQYQSNTNKKWVHTIGGTSTLSTGLHGEYEKAYTESSVVVDKEVSRNQSFRLPVSLGVGYALTQNDRLTFSVDVNYHHWPYQKVAYSASYTNPSLTVSTGIEYAFKQKFNGVLIEKSYLSAGLSFDNHYIRIKNNPLTQYAFYMGGGTSLARNIFVNAALSFGTKGLKQLGQIKENFTQYTIGITLRDLWLGPKYTRRYD